MIVILRYSLILGLACDSSETDHCSGWCVCHFSDRRVNTVFDSQSSADFTQSFFGLKPEPHPSVKPDTAVGVQAGHRVSVPMHL